MTQDTHPSKGAQEPVATRQILGEALVGLKFARGRLLQLWTDYHTRPKTSVIDGVIRRVEHALAAPPRDAASQTPTPDPKSQVTGDLDYWADVALENHTGREVALTRAEKAEADLARVTAERDKAIDERDDARSTLSAWFDLSTKTEEAVTPVLLDGLKGYLRTSKNGGMPTALADHIAMEGGRALLLEAAESMLNQVRSTDAALSEGEAEAPGGAKTHVEREGGR